MINFKTCYPDANNFKKIIKIKKLDDWKIDYVKLDKDIGYWIADNPFYDNGFDLFKNLVSAFPIQKDNNNLENFDPNPFDTIHLPEWIYKDICFLIKEFYLKQVNLPIADPEIHEWGNVYFKKRARPISCWRIPHIDYSYGMVGNLWFTDHAVTDSSTKLYRYNGIMKDEIYDFQLDENHKMYQEWKSLAENPKRSDQWFNMTELELARWGFEHVGDAPTTEGTMTMYKSNVCHNAYISNSVDFRWSHTFAFSHLVPKNNPIMLKDLFL
jgi:hypothetical protein